MIYSILWHKAEIYTLKNNKGYFFIVVFFFTILFVQEKKKKKKKHTNITPRRDKVY